MPDRPPSRGHRASTSSAVVPSLRIAVQDGPHAGTVVDFSHAGEYLVGRNAAAHVSLVHDLLASVEHCRIELNERGCIISDLGSRQGTLVNGRAVKREFLSSGDEIKVGMSRLTVSITDPVDHGTTVIRRGDWSQAGAPANAGAATASVSVLDLPGYTIVRKIGAGGMGVVYEARQNVTGNRVAIKTMIPVPGAPRQAVQLFLREVEVLSQLQHPRIVRFVEAGHHAGQVYLVMEYVETIDLLKVVDTISRPKQIQVYCGIIGQILEALDYAHVRKLVHRDIKPGNVLVSRDNNRIAAKLADFGLAKNFEHAGLSQMTADGEIRGTLSFMPWEQLQNSRYARPLVDIYSAGATLFWFLTGKAPGHVSALGKSAADWGIPRELAAVIDQSLAERPGDRFQSASEFRNALAPFVRASADRHIT
jgi:eukaryotic-like serine/threonine-protein kinase